MRWIIVLLVIAIGSVSVSSSAAAKPWKPTSDTANKYLREGVALYNAGDFRGALDKFLAALDAEPLGTGLIIRNTARTYRALRDWRKAKDYYDMLLNDAALDDNERDDIKSRLEIVTWFYEAATSATAADFDRADTYYSQLLERAQLTPEERAYVVSAIKDLAHKRATLPAATEPAKPPAEPTTPPSAPADKLPAADKAEPIGTPESENLMSREGRISPPRWYEDRLGWIAVGSGAAVATLGVVFVGHAESLDDEAADERNQEKRTALSDRASSFWLGGAGCLVVGGAAIATGVVRLILVPDGRDARLTPVVGVTEDGASMSLVGSF